MFAHQISIENKKFLGPRQTTSTTMDEADSLPLMSNCVVALNKENIFLPGVPLVVFSLS